jgi:hypothetical protein
MNRPGPPIALREILPCRQRPDLFVPVSKPPRAADGAPSVAYSTARRNERAELRYRHAKAQRICNGAPGYDDPCPLRMQCLRWAVAAKERIVAGGVLVTRIMITGYHEDPERGDRAAEEATTPEDWARQLAEYGRPGKRQPDQGRR